MQNGEIGLEGEKGMDNMNPFQQKNEHWTWNFPTGRVIKLNSTLANLENFTGNEYEMNYET